MKRFLGTLLGVATLVACGQVQAGEDVNAWKQKFLWGMYAVPKTDIKVVKELGFDYVHNYGPFEGSKNHPVVASIEHRISYLDEAHKHGMKVMTGISRYQIKHGQFDKIREFVKVAKDHPALGAWYLYDEPCLHLDVPRENLARVYKMLKTNTPGVPVICAEGWGKNWRDTVKYCDMLLPDFYPVRVEPYPQAKLSLMFRFTEMALTLGKPVAMALQSYRPDHAKYHKNDPERMKQIRFPSPLEHRASFYGSLAQGVQGMMWFSYAIARKVDSKYLVHDLKPILFEERLFLDLVQPGKNKVKRIREYNDENDLIVGYWETPGGAWLVIYNNWPQPNPNVNANVAPHIDNALLTPWGATAGGTIEAKAGRVRLEARPWEAFVWRVKKLKPTPTKSTKKSK